MARLKRSLQQLGELTLVMDRAVLFLPTVPRVILKGNSFRIRREVKDAGSCEHETLRRVARAVVQTTPPPGPCASPGLALKMARATTSWRGAAPDAGCRWGPLLTTLCHGRPVATPAQANPYAALNRCCSCFPWRGGR
jgi:hypothetical protein